MTGDPAQELALVEATRAARAGELDEAARILSEFPPDTTSPPVLDLLARVHAQRGDLGAAVACWTALLDRDSSDQSAAAGQALISDIRAGRQRAHPRTGSWPLWIVVMVAVAVVGAIGWVILAGQPSTRAVPTPAPPVATVPPLPAGAPEATTAATQLGSALAGPGRRVIAVAEGVEVVFDRGLFRRDSRLSDAGSAQLAALGHQMTGRPVWISVTGHTAAVPGGPKSGGSPVGLARAAVAAEALAAASGLPLTRFTLASGDQQDRPHTAAADNRTATLFVGPAPPPHPPRLRR